jgi:hypothetical protein
MRLADRTRQKRAKLGVLCILFSPIPRGGSQVVRQPPLAFCRCGRGPSCWRHYPSVLSPAGRESSVISRANGTYERIKWGFILSHNVRDAEQRMRAKTPRGKGRKVSAERALASRSPLSRRSAVAGAIRFVFNCPRSVYFDERRRRIFKQGLDVLMAEERWPRTPTGCLSTGSFVPDSGQM